MRVSFRGRLAVVGEPKAAARVEHQIVRRHETCTVAFMIQNFDLACCKIHPFDAATCMRCRRMAGDEQTRALVEFEAATIIADVQRAVGADRQSIGPTAWRGNRLLFSVRLYPRDPARRDFDYHDRAVFHRHRPLGKSQPRRNFTNVHLTPPKLARLSTGILHAQNNFIVSLFSTPRLREIHYAWLRWSVRKRYSRPASATGSSRAVSCHSAGSKCGKYASPANSP